MKGMSLSNDEFYRIAKLPPYVFAVVNEMKARLRADQQDVVNFAKNIEARRAERQIALF